MSFMVLADVIIKKLEKGAKAWLELLFLMAWSVLNLIFVNASF